MLQGLHPLWGVDYAAPPMGVSLAVLHAPRVVNLRNSPWSFGLIPSIYISCLPSTGYWGLPLILVVSLGDWGLLLPECSGLERMLSQWPLTVHATASL